MLGLFIPRRLMLLSFALLLTLSFGVLAKPPLPIPSDRATAELLTNTGFESSLDGWTGKNTAVFKSDKVKCDKPGKPVAHTGQCAFLFRGNAAGSKSTIEQTIIDFSSLIFGVDVSFSAYIDSRSAPIGTNFGKAIIKYIDGSKIKFALAVPSATGYTQVTDSKPLSPPDEAGITKVKVSFQYGEVSGKLLIDDVSFAVVDDDGTPTRITGTPNSTTAATSTPGGVTSTATATVSATSAATESFTATISATSTLENSATPSVSPTPTATTIPVTQKLFADDGMEYDNFGSAIALDGTTLMVAVPFPNDPFNLNLDGAVYVFNFNGTSWMQQTKLTASDSNQYSNGFGYAIALQGDIALIGAPTMSVEGETDRGAVYVFKFDGVTWVEQAKLFADAGTSSDNFGNAIAIDGDTAIIGAASNPATDDAAPGTAYIFKFNGTNWVQQAKLTGENSVAEETFGASVDIEGNTVIIGAPYSYTTGITEGAAYVFTYDGTDWAEQQRLTPDDAADFDQFGSSVALEGNTAVIGARTVTISENEYQGASYVFKRSGSNWTQQQKLVADDGAPYDRFGSKVAIQNNEVFVGAPAPYSQNSTGGKVYTFTSDGIMWIQDNVLEGFEGIYEGYGHEIVLQGATVVIGAPLTQIGSNFYQGAVYVMPIP